MLVVTYGRVPDQYRDAVLQYVRNGGGLFIESYKGQVMADLSPQFALLDHLDARLLLEGVTDPENTIRASVSGPTLNANSLNRRNITDSGRCAIGVWRKLPYRCC